MKKLLVLGLAAALSLPIATGCNNEKKPTTGVSKKGTCLEEKIKDQEVGTKTVNLDVYMGCLLGKEESYERRSIIFRQVKEFYSRMFINVKINFVDKEKYDLMVTERLKNGRGEINNIIFGLFTYDDFVEEYKHVLGYKKDHMPEATAITKRGIALKESFTDRTPDEEAGTICHEIGHFFGLWHSHKFYNDPVGEYVYSTRKAIPNFMSYRPNNKLDPDFGFAFNVFQVQQMHSFLSKGIVYETVKKVNFDFNRYLSDVGKSCGYKQMKRRFPRIRGRHN